MWFIERRGSNPVGVDAVLDHHAVLVMVQDGNIKYGGARRNECTERSASEDDVPPILDSHLEQRSAK